MKRHIDATSKIIDSPALNFSKDRHGQSSGALFYTFWISDNIKYHTFEKHQDQLQYLPIHAQDDSSLMTKFATYGLKLSDGLLQGIFLGADSLEKSLKLQKFLDAVIAANRDSPKLTEVVIDSVKAYKDGEERESGVFVLEECLAAPPAKAVKLESLAVTPNLQSDDSEGFQQSDSRLSAVFERLDAISCRLAKLESTTEKNFKLLFAKLQTFQTAARASSQQTTCSRLPRRDFEDVAVFAHDGGQFLLSSIYHRNPNTFMRSYVKRVYGREFLQNHIFVDGAVADEDLSVSSRTKRIPVAQHVVAELKDLLVRCYDVPPSDFHAAWNSVRASLNSAGRESKFKQLRHSH